MNEKKKLKDLIVFILIVAIGISLIVVGFILDQNGRNSFVKTEDIPKYSPAWYIYLLEFGGAILFLSSFGFLYSFLQENYHIKKLNVRQMSVIGIFSALSILLYYFAKFNLPFFPPWLDIQFSDIPALLVSFMFGPISGSLVIVVRFICKLPGTSTLGVGELADLLIGISLCLTSGIIYKRNRKFKGAIVAMSLGMIIATVVAMLANWLILIPAYKGLAGFSQGMLTSMVDGIISGGKGVVTDNNFMIYYIFTGVLPFNLFRYVLVFIISLIIYKRIHKLIIRYAGRFNIEVNEEEKEENVQ